jgi:hypothetical protein
MGRKPNPPRRKPKRPTGKRTVKTGGRARKCDEIARATDPNGVDPSLPVAGGDPKVPEEVERHTTTVLELLTRRTPRLDVYRLMEPMPPRTVDRYIALARDRMVELQHATQKQLLADSQARVEWLAAHGGLESRDQVVAERLLAELRGLLGVRGSVVVNQMVQVNGQAGAAASTGDLSRLSPAEQVDFEHLTAVYEGELSQVPVDALVARLEAATGRRVVLVPGGAENAPGGLLGGPEGGGER